MSSDFIDLTDLAAAKIREQLPPEGDGGALRLSVKHLENGDFHYAMGFDNERREGDRHWAWRMRDGDLAARVPGPPVAGNWPPTSTCWLRCIFKCSSICAFSRLRPAVPQVAGRP